MKCYFYKTKSDNIVVNKTLTPITINGNTYLNIVFKDSEDKGEPMLEVAYHSQLMDANYCYIEELGYYYSLSEPVLGSQRLIFSCKPDILMTKKSEILQLKCIIARQENEFNAYLNDDRLPVLNNQYLSTVSFDRGFLPKSGQMILVVNGKGGAS